MGHNKLSLWVHLVWGVKKRRYLIHEDAKKVLYSKMREVFESKGYDVVEMNGMPDHVHILLRLNPTHTISEIVKNIKGATSTWLNHQVEMEEYFEWQDGYGAFSVSSYKVGAVVKYIQNQQQHHANNDFETEMKFLNSFSK